MPQFVQGLGFTSQITVASGAFSQIAAQSNCQDVTVGEDPSVAGFPTTDFLIARPLSTATPRRLTGGSSYRFTSPIGLFKKGQIIGYVQAVRGSTTFFQDEE
jgi:hypothetical protein